MLPTHLLEGPRRRSDLKMNHSIGFKVLQSLFRGDSDRLHIVHQSVNEGPKQTEETGKCNMS